MSVAIANSVSVVTGKKGGGMTCCDCAKATDPQGQHAAAPAEPTEPDAHVEQEVGMLY